MLLLLFEQFLIVINFYSVNVMLTLYNFYMTNGGRIKKFHFTPCIIPQVCYTNNAHQIEESKAGQKKEPAKDKEIRIEYVQTEPGIA